MQNRATGGLNYDNKLSLFRLSNNGLNKCSDWRMWCKLRSLDRWFGKYLYFKIVSKFYQILNNFFFHVGGQKISMKSFCQNSEVLDIMYTWQKVNHALCSTICQFYLNFIGLSIESLLRNFKCKFLLIVIWTCPKRAYPLELWNECQVNFRDGFYYKQECKLQEWKFTHN